MSVMKTVRLKPNPAGKDRSRYGAAPAAQLAAEWADIQNTGQAPVDVTGIKLYHVAYSGTTDNGTWQEVTGFTRGILRAGEVVRVHSGSGPESVLRTEDRVGADHHIFTGKDRYVWNNDRGDCAAIGSTDRNLTDKAWYDQNPPERAILERVGDKLVARSAAYAGRRC